MKSRLHAIRAEGHVVGRRGRIPVWAAVAIAVVLTLSALVGVLGFSSSLQTKRDAAALAQDLDTLITSIHDSNAATTGPTPGSELQASAAILQVEPAIGQLGRLDDGSATTKLISAFEQLRQSVAANEQGMLTGQLSAADAEINAAESNRLLADAIDETRSALNRSAVTAERFFQLFATVMFLLVAGAISWLMYAANKSRAALETQKISQESRFRALQQLSGDVISLLDRDGNVVTQTSSTLRLLGRSDFWLAGRKFGEIVHEAERPLFNDLIQQAVQNPGEPIGQRVRLSHGDGSWRWFDATALDTINQPELDGILLTCRLDEQSARPPQIAIAPGQAQVYHPVSGLLSEPFFRDRLQHALLRSNRKGESVALLVIDLGPREALASLSDDARAAVLRTISGRIARSIRSEDSAAHLDGFELAIVLEESDMERAQSVAGRVTEQIQTPVSHLNGQVRLNARIGIAVKSDPRDNVETMLLDARASLRGKPGSTRDAQGVAEPDPIDVVVSVVATNGSNPKQESFAALAVSAGNGKERISLPPSTDPKAEKVEAQIADDRVFDPSEFEIQFLPVLALQSGEIVEIEAVARWRQPQRGLMSIEASGIADLATPWVFERACSVALSLPPTRSGRRVRVSINITPATPLDDMMVDGVAGILLTTGVDPSSIQIEIPVRMLDEESNAYETSLAALKQLRDLGICLAIDGTGADIDRLPDLTRMPVSAVKIDRSVVSLLDRSADRRALVREIVERAQPLNVSVTGTGVETLEQAERLWDLGADQGQGPLFFKTFSEEQLQGLFANENSMAAD